MTQKSISFFQNFLTSGARLQDPATLRRIKVLNAFDLAFVILAPFLGLFYFYVGAVLLFYACIIAGLLGILIIFILRITKNPLLVGNLAVLVLWATLAVIRWHTGAVGATGLILLSWVWNAVLILMAIFITGYLWGTIWACLVFVETAFAVHLFRAGYQLPNLIPLKVSAVYSLGAYLLGLLAILLFAFLFEKQSDDALAREEEKAQALRDSTKYIEDLLLRSPVPTFVVDRQHRVVQWNRACQQLTGVSPGEVIGKQVWEGFAINSGSSLADKIMEDPESLREQYGSSALSASDSGSFCIEADLPQLCGGSRAILNAAPILDEEGMVRGAIQTIQAIEKDSGDKDPGPKTPGRGLEDVYPIYKIDRNGKITYWNRACEEILGYTASQMVGDNPLPLLSKPYRSNFRETIIRAMQGSIIKDREWKYYDQDGQPVYVVAKIMPLPSASGEIHECMVFNTVITDLKLRVKKLERYAMDSKEKYKRLTNEHQLLKRNIAAFIRKKEE
ncbi:MAG: PAS domain-containing protein [Desulfatiglandaceae bacterium]